MQRRLIAAACVAANWTFAAAAPGLAQPADESLHVRVYDVSDLIAPRPNYPYRGSVLPTTGTPMTLPGGLGGGGFGLDGMSGMGGGMGGGGFGGGSGFFAVPDPTMQVQLLSAGVGQFGGEGMGAGGMGALGGEFPSESGASFQFSADELIEAIQLTVEPDSWQQGGVITPLGGFLVVRQTAPVHMLIEQLLGALRTGGGTANAVTVEAWWLLLDPEQAERLSGGANGEGIDPEALRELTDAIAYRGRITCFSDQTVHLVSGERRTVIAGAVPTVGLGAAAYQPVVLHPNVGALLEVTPTLLPEGGECLVNVRSVVTAWGEQAPAAELTTRFEGSEQEGVRAPGGEARATIDRVALQAHELATTLRVPLGAPALVGGMSVATRGAADEPHRQLYLAIRVSGGGRPAD